MTALRRYAPFALLVAAQTVLVLVAPSRGSTPPSGPLGGQFPGGPAASTSTGQRAGLGAEGGTGAAGGAAGTAGTPAAGGSPAGGGRLTGAAGTSGAGATGGGAPAAGRAGATATGTTGRGKPFCVTGLLEHPPCTPRWAGGGNGGATWPGVTAKTVTVVMYRPKDNAAVNAILRETGTYIPAQAERDQFQLVADWVNKNYQLYGRKLKPVYVQGSCEIAPPQDSCFRNEADRIVAAYKPFAVFWDNDTNEPAFFDELSRKGVVNWGGWAFSDTFSDNLRPYHYDLFMGGDTQARITGEWYCRRLAGGKARYAGDPTLRAKTRKVVVVYPDTPQTTPSAKLLQQIIAGCAGGNAVVDGKYSSDTSTAAQQATTNTSKYKAAGVTTVLWFSDPIAPAYGTKAATAQNYFPENVIAGSGLLDYDALAQTYDPQQWRRAFGPSDLGATTPITQLDAGRIWKAQGRSGTPNPNANLLTSYLLSLAGGITAAGPKLTPLSYEYGLLTLPGYDSWEKWRDPRLVYLKWGRGDYTGISDVREVWFDPNRRSATNGRNGSYVALSGGRRYQQGQIPSGAPPLPAGFGS